MVSKLNKKSLGTILKEARQKKNISQSYLAKKIHVTRQAISSWERDISLPDIQMLNALCKYLELDKTKIIIFYHDIPETITKHSKNKIILTLSILAIIIIIILCAYIFNASNKEDFKMYSLSINSDKFVLLDGTLIKSKTANRMQIGSIYFLESQDEERYIDYIRIYSVVDENITEIINSIYMEGFMSQGDKPDEAKYFTTIDEPLEDFYIEITVKENKETSKTYQYKLDLKEISKQ